MPIIMQGVITRRAGIVDTLYLGPNQQTPQENGNFNNDYFGNRLTRLMKEYNLTFIRKNS